MKKRYWEDGELMNNIVINFKYNLPFARADVFRLVAGADWLRRILDARKDMIDIGE